MAEVAEVAAVTKVAVGLYLQVGGFKSEFLFPSNVQGEKSASSKCKLSRIN